MQLIPCSVLCFLPFDAQSGGQVSSVSICDVGVFPQKHRDLFVGVQSDTSGHQHRPILITSQFYVVWRLGALLGFLRHGCAGGVCFSQTWSWEQKVRTRFVKAASSVLKHWGTIDFKSLWSACKCGRFKCCCFLTVQWSRFTSDILELPFIMSWIQQVKILEGLYLCYLCDLEYLTSAS